MLFLTRARSWVTSEKQQALPAGYRLLSNQTAAFALTSVEAAEAVEAVEA